MNKIFAILGGIGAGAALMFLLDPDRGRRRRALIRDKAVGLSNDLRKTMDKKSADLKNRAEGLVHETKSLISGAKSEQETYATGQESH